MTYASQRAGFGLIVAFFFLALGFTALVGLVGWGTLESRVVREREDRAAAFAVAEAGIEYYRWHLLHAPEDFTDGGEAASSYTHVYADLSGNTIGSFTLHITPPEDASSTATIVSEGSIDRNPAIVEKITVTIASSSIVRFMRE